MEKIKTHRLRKLEATEYAAAKVLYSYLQDNPYITGIRQVQNTEMRELAQSLGYFKRGGQTLFEQVRVNYHANQLRDEDTIDNHPCGPHRKEESAQTFLRRHS